MEISIEEKDSIDEINTTILIFHLLFSDYIFKNLSFTTRLNIFFFLFVGIEIVLVRAFNLFPIITISVLIIGYLFPPHMVAMFMLIYEKFLTICLHLENKHLSKNHLT